MTVLFVVVVVVVVVRELLKISLSILYVQNLRSYTRGQI